MIPLYLVNQGILAKPALYLSDFFERHRASYYDALMQVRVSNNLIHWVRFFLQGISETARKGRDVFQQILALRSQVEMDLLSLGKRAPLARKALNVLYRQPIMTSKQLEIALKITQPTADKLITSMIDKAILVEKTGQQRGRVYLFEPYIQLFLT